MGHRWHLVGHLLGQLDRSPPEPDPRPLLPAEKSKGLVQTEQEEMGRSLFRFHLIQCCSST